MSVIEDYEQFAQRLLRLRRREEEEEHSKPSAPPSLIRVHGRAILPPLLSEKQRGEMQRHRDAAQKAAGHRKLEEDPRKAYLQNLLQHVQLVRIPTLEELLQESETTIPSLNSQNTSVGSLSECHVFSETTEDSPLLLPCSVSEGEDGPSPPSSASSVSRAYHIARKASQESYNESCLADQQDSEQGPRPSSPHAALPQSVSSGYTPLTSGTIDAGSGSCGSSEGTNGTEAFFLSSSSNTITRMPEISIHPPLDGEELEISGLDYYSLSDDSAAEQYICDITFQEISERSLPESKENGDDVQSTGIYDLESDRLPDRSEDAVSLLEYSNFSESSDTLSAPHDRPAQRRAKHEPAEPEPAHSNANEAMPSDYPRRMSIQALLRRSQEYRQQQRVLRNQAKNAKVQKRNQEPRRKPEEQSLSDKENDVSVTVTPEERKTSVIDTEFPGKITDVKSESQHSTGVTVENGESVDGLETSVGEDDQSVEHETSVGPPNSHTTVPSTGNVVAPGALGSDHMGQLQSHLSTLREEIIHLESRLKEDLENHSQTRSCRESELRLEGVKHSMQIPNEQHVPLHQNGWDSFPDLPPVGADFPLQGTSGMPPPPVKCVSAAQQMRVPDVSGNFSTETVVSCKVSVLSDTSNRLADRRKEVAVNGHDASPSQALNRSYDVNSPSFLWLHNKSGSDSGSGSVLVQGEHLTPERGDEGQGKGSKVKRRLLMHTAEEVSGKSPDTNRGGGARVVRPRSNIPKAAVKNQAQLRQVHAAQVQALQDDHKKQQEQLLQKAARYHLLHRVSAPWSVSSSRLRDTVTFSTLHQPSSALSERCRHLLSAAVKGYLTRRLLRTERVAQLVRTIRDTQQVLLGLLLEGGNRGEAIGRQDLMLQERVSLQLRAARFELSDIFFSLTAKERMQLITWDRYLIREREFRQQSGDSVQPRQKSCLSAVTQKALERKREEIMAQKKGVQMQKKKKTGHRNGCKTGLSAEKPKEAKRGQFRANPLRVPMNSYSP